MNFYFPISQYEFIRHNMSNHVPLSFELTEDYLLNFTMSINSDDVVKVINYFREKYPSNEQYAVCKAHVDDKIAIEGLRAAMVGDVMRKVPVTISEITWFK